MRVFFTKPSTAIFFFYYSWSYTHNNSKIILVSPGLTYLHTIHVHQCLFHCPHTLPAFRPKTKQAGRRGACHALATEINPPRPACNLATKKRPLRTAQSIPSQLNFCSGIEALGWILHFVEIAKQRKPFYG